jgi:hypothetical protein
MRALVALLRQKFQDGTAAQKPKGSGVEPRQPKFSPIIKPTDNWNFSPVHL